MEYLGTGFVLTIAGMRLRVRIALEDTPDPCRPAREPAAPDARDAGAYQRPARQPDNASSLN